MDFELTISRLINRFQDKNLEYGFIGGFALGMLGVNRATINIDFLIKNLDTVEVDKIMKDLGYDLIFHSDNFSQYESPMKPFGRVDFLHPKSPTIETMLKRKKVYTVFNHSLKIFVLIPEDIIGLKLQAMKNNPERAPLDENDIYHLLKLHAKSLNHEIIRNYGIKLGMEEYVQKLIRKADEDA